MDYLNRGFAICNKCGAVMDRKEDPRGGCDIYACPSCGWEVDEIMTNAQIDEVNKLLTDHGDALTAFYDEGIRYGMGLGYKQVLCGAVIAIVAMSAVEAIKIIKFKRKSEKES